MDFDVKNPLKNGHFRVLGLFPQIPRTPRSGGTPPGVSPGPLGTPWGPPGDPSGTPGGPSGAPRDPNISPFCQYPLYQAYVVDPSKHPEPPRITPFGASEGPWGPPGGLRGPQGPLRPPTSAPIYALLEYP